MNKSMYRYYLWLTTNFCVQCKNCNSGKTGPCKVCVQESKGLETPLKYEERKKDESSS